jgi:peroxiredoxin
MRALLVVLLLLIAGCSTGKDAVVAGSEFQFVAPGGQTKITYEGADRKVVSGLSGPSLLEPDKKIDLSEYSGKVVVVNIWGSWCPPCRTEAEQMQQVYNQTKDSGVQVLGIDVKEHSPQPAQDFTRDRNLTYPSIYDDSGRTLLAFKGYPPNAVPSTIVLDRQHRVAAVFLVELLASDLLPVVQRLASESA